MTTTSPPRRPAESGFSLVELLAVLVLLGVLASLAAPGMQGVTARAKSRGALDQLAADIALARSLAVRDGKRTALVIQGPSRYALVRNPGASADTVKRTDLARDFRGVQLAPSTGQLTFDSRGLVVGPTISWIRAAHNGARDSLTISSVGRVYREY